MDNYKTYTNTVCVIKPVFQLVHFRDQRAASKFVAQRKKYGEECRLYQYDPARAFVDALIEMKKAGIYEQR